MSRAWDERLAAIDAGQAAARAAERFGLAADPVAVSAGANLVFRGEDPRGTVYLRLNHATQRTPDQLAANVAWLRHLEAGGAPVSPALESGRGRWVEDFEVGGEPVVATAVRAVPGRAVEPRPEEYAAWGRALARLHRATDGFALPDDGSLRDWRVGWEETRARLPAEERAAWRALRAVEANLAPLPRERGAQGMTHADCNRTNALFDGSRVWIIDFDEPTFHWFAADVARPFRELTPEQDAYAGCLEALLAGYREERPFAPVFEAALPVFVLMKNVEVYAWDLSGDWAGDELPGGRDRARELARIRATFEAV